MKTLFNRVTFFTIALLFLSCFNDTDEKEIDDHPTLIAVTGGTFIMGGPIHSVTLSNYSIGKTEVTVAQYRAYCAATGTSMPSAPNWGWNDSYPIVNVSWNDAIKYCKWLSGKLNKTITLPTEAQWEFAARGGNKSNGYTYSGSNDLNTVGWYGDNSGYKVHSVAQKKANELGLYDMSGNVCEWCSEERVLRGGCWHLLASFCRVAYRSTAAPSAGSMATVFVWFLSRS